MGAVGYIAIGVVAAIAVFGFYASFCIGSGVYLKALCRGRSDLRTIALTFDDGPDERMTPRVLDILARRGIRATFFLVGERAGRCPELVRRMVAEGHMIGNHTLTHSGMFPLRGRARMAAELERTRRILQALTGRCVRLFRPPFGVTNPHVARAAREGGYATIGWSVRSFDTVARTSRRKVLSRVVGRLHPGAVVLLHDRCEGADRLLEALIDEADGRGYRFETVDRLFEIEGYEK